jgi:hypothetical protein
MCLINLSENTEEVIFSYRRFVACHPQLLVPMFESDFSKFPNHLLGRIKLANLVRFVSWKTTPAEHAP